MRDGVEAVPPAREEFVDVSLMADVKKEVIGGRVENPVEGNGQFHHTQVRAEVSTGPAQHANELLPDLLREPRQILHWDLFDVLRTLDGIQQRGCHKSRLDKQVGGASTSLLSLGRSLRFVQDTLHDRSIFLLG